DRVQKTGDRQTAIRAAVTQDRRRGHEPQLRHIVVEPLRMRGIVRVRARDAREKILERLARQQIAIAQRRLAELRQERITPRIGHDGTDGMPPRAARRRVDRDAVARRNGSGRKRLDHRSPRLLVCWTKRASSASEARPRVRDPLGTPRPTGDVVRRQVSWLTARSRPPPSRNAPVAIWRPLAAYSCGG